MHLFGRAGAGGCRAGLCPAASNAAAGHRRAAATTTPPPGGISVSNTGGIAISADVCDKLRRAAAAEPGADYRPGVDVNGDAVAPADLPSNAPPMPLDNLPIVIGARLQQRYGLAGNAALLHRGAMIGLLTLRDGRAYFNGEPISGGERDMMLAACAEAKR